jgi:hypothetical protein
MSAAISGIKSERIAGPIVALIALGALAVANFDKGPGEQGGPAEYALMGTVALLVTALVFGRVIPNARQGARAGRVALIMAVAATLTLVFFWTGLPYVFAPAAILLGSAAPRSGESVAAVTLGSAAYLLGLVGVFFA